MVIAAQRGHRTARYLRMIVNPVILWVKISSVAASMCVLCVCVVCVIVGDEKIDTSAVYCNQHISCM